ncbi:MAG: Fic family protein [Propionibacteriaceae bacterium]|nr:Fic family protein [Propionibacteriaceae bacterium]
MPAIADAQLTLTSELAQLVIAAQQMVSEFDASSLGSVPFASVLLRSESASSSQIEALTASARRLSLAMLGDGRSANAVLIAANVRAMLEATSTPGPITVDTILTIHQAIMRDHDPAGAGRLRTEQVWIGGVSPVVARYAPPQAERVPAAMEDLVRFIGRTDLPPLAQAAIAHAHFETVHPFTDGNGRTGRALVTAMLRRSGIAPHVPIPLSAGLLTNTDTYFAALTAYRNGDVAQIVARFVAATDSAILHARTLRDDIDQVRRSILDTATRVTPALRAVINLCVADGAFTARTLTEAGVPVATAYRIVERLVAAGVLRQERKIGGQRVWSAPGVFQALDRFAQAAGRRTWR